MLQCLSLYMSEIDYLIIGHITRDLTPAGTYKVGGSVAYSGRMATALGCRTAAITSAASAFNLPRALPDVQVYCVPAGQTTTFENIYLPHGREQVIHTVASPLTLADIPAGWREAAIVHLAPLAQEVDPALVHCFAHSVVAMTPQGWMRCWDAAGKVFPCEWALAEVVLPYTDAVIISNEDLADEAMLHRFRQAAPLLVMTQGPAGCTVFAGDEVRRFPTEVTTEIDLTGAGDIFATAFFIQLQRTGGDPWKAARYANRIAAYSITRPDLETKVKYVARQVGGQQMVS